MIIVTPKTYDISGAVIIDKTTATTDVNGVSRRVQRTATLDGDAVTVDHGYSHSDRNLTIGISRITETMALRLAEIVELHTRVYASVNDDSYECSPESFRLIGPDAVLHLLVIAKAN